MTAEQAVAFRVAAHNLHKRLPATRLVEAAAACGIQDFPPGNGAISLFARVEGVTPESVHTAIARGRLVALWGPRGAAYLVPATDVQVFTVGAQPSDDESLRTTLTNCQPLWTAANMQPLEAMDAMAAIIAKALAKGPVDKGTVCSELHGKIPAELEPWCRGCAVHHVPDNLFRYAVVAAGTRLAEKPDGKGVAILERDPRPSARKPAARRRARLELLRRFLRCYAPATHGDFAGLVGIGTADARASWEELAEEMTEVRLDGRKTFVLNDDLAALRSPPRAEGVRLVPAYDPFLNQRDRATLFPDKSQAKRVWLSVANPGVVLADGLPVGLWRGRKKGKALEVTFEPFGRWPGATRKEAEAEAEALVPFRGCETVKTVLA